MGDKEGDHGHKLKKSAHVNTTVGPIDWSLVLRFGLSTFSRNLYTYKSLD